VCRLVVVGGGVPVVHQRQVDPDPVGEPLQLKVPVEPPPGVLATEQDHQQRGEEEHAPGQGAEQDRDRDHQDGAEGGAQPVEGPVGVVDGELDRVSGLFPVCHLLHDASLSDLISAGSRGRWAVRGAGEREGVIGVQAGAGQAHADHGCLRAFPQLPGSRGNWSPHHRCGFSGSRGWGRDRRCLAGQSAGPGRAHRRHPRRLGHQDPRAPASQAMTRTGQWPGPAQRVPPGRCRAVTFFQDCAGRRRWFEAGHPGVAIVTPARPGDQWRAILPPGLLPGRPASGIPV